MMERGKIWQRCAIMVGFYGFWWLRTVGWVALNAGNGASGWPIGILLGEGVLLLAPWALILGAFAAFSGGWGQITAALVTLTVLSSQFLSGYAAGILPGLTLFTGWVLATAKLKCPFGRSTTWVAGILSALTLLCLLSPQASARLYVAGYHSPYPAVVSTYTADRSNLKRDHYVGYDPVKPAVAEPVLLGESAYPLTNQNTMAVRVYRLGFLYWPLEDRWWVV